MMSDRVDPDVEFGVPFPGVAAPRERWTQTALKRLPVRGRLDWRQLFGREAPVVLDLGCGNGRFVIASALLRPSHDHLGLDLLPVVIRYATRRANQRGLTNVRYAVGDAHDFLQRLVEPRSVAEIHLYHPQPYYDVADVHRRLITPEFLLLAHRALAVGGQLFVQTDNPSYWRYVKQAVPLFFDFEDRHEPWPDAPKGRTRREIVALQHNLKVYRGQGVRREGLDEQQVRQLAEQLPPPIFDADRRLKELDRLA